MTSAEIIGLIGIVIALIAFTLCALRGLHTYITCAVAVAIVVLFNRLDVTEAFTVSYWPSFLAYLQGYWWIFVGGALFGAVMNVTGASLVVGRFIMKKFSKNATLAATVLFTILQFCGISVFGGAVFAVLPMLYTIYREQDIPRRFAPAVICFSALTLACVTPGATAAHNLIPTTYFGLPLTAGAVVGFACLIAMLLVGQFFLDRCIAKAKRNGEHWETRPGDFPEAKEGEEEHYPPLWKIVIAMAAFPLCVNLPFMAVMHLFFRQLIATAVAMVVLFGYWDMNKLIDGWGTFVPQSLTIMFGQCAVMGFGGVFTATAAYSHVVGLLQSIPGTPLISCAVSTTLMSCVTGSATSGINITLESMGPIWLAQAGSAVPAAAFSRVCGLSSLVFDSMPYNGAINGLTTGMGCKMKDAYIPIFWVTVVTPGIGTVLMIILFSIFPFLP